MLCSILPAPSFLFRSAVCFSLKAEEAAFIHPSYTVWDYQMTALESNRYYDIIKWFCFKKANQPLTTYSSLYFCCFHLSVASSVANIETLELKKKCFKVQDLHQTTNFWLKFSPSCWKTEVSWYKCLGWQSTACTQFYNSDCLTPTFNKYTLYLMALLNF